MAVSTFAMLDRRMEFPEGIRLYGISDVHIGSREFDEGAFQATVRDILSEPNRFVVLVGDLVDNGLKSSVSSPYEAVMQPREQREFAVELLWPLRERILAIVPGNHEDRSRRESDFDPTEIIAANLGLESIYRPDIAFLLLTLGERAHGGKQAPSYCVAITHGAGGGMLLGSGFNTVDRFASVSGADLMITGHTHKPGSVSASRLICDRGRQVMVQQDYKIMICTAWLSYGGYAAKKMLRPTLISPNYAVLNGKERQIQVVV